MYIFDLAVPRDVDPALGELPNITLYNIENIEKQIRQNIQGRQEKITHAEEIITNEVQIFLKNQLNGEARK